jgi:hypothetical protein
LKICPEWDLLDEIYGSKVNINPPYLHETGIDEGLEELTDVEVVFHTDELPLSSPTPTASELEVRIDQVRQVRKQLEIPKSYAKGIQKNSMSALTEAQNKRAEVLILKTQNEAERLEVL